MRKIFFIVILILLQLGAVTVSSGQPEKKALTKKIMEKSGMNEQVRQLPLIHSSMLSKDKDKLPPELYSIFERETAKALDPERILKEISRQTENNLDIKSMRAVLSWLESDLGQKITAMEKSYATPEGMQGLNEFAALLEKTPASKKRLDLVQRFFEASHSVELEVDMQISMALAIATAINSVLPEEKREDIDVIKKKVEALRPQLQEEARKRAITGSLYAYRTLKDEEFQRYVEFAESASGKRYHRVTFSAIKDAMERVSLDFAKALENVFKKFPRGGDAVSSGKVLVHLKNGSTLTWNNYTEKGDWYCTWLAEGEFCVKKSDVSSIEPR
jgi:uncharacterized protein YjgD (DUF1641 family)